MAKTYKTVIYITLREEHRLRALQSRAEDNIWTQQTGSERDCAKPHNEMTNILYTSSIFHPSNGATAQIGPWPPVLRFHNNNVLRCEVVSLTTNPR
jgi:hypothetical protein